MAEIAGLVFDRNTRSPLENATVVASDNYPTGRRRNYSATTDSSGLYVIRNLPNSEFTVRAAKTPDYTSNRAGGIEVDLRTRNNATDINIPLTPRRPRQPTPPTPPTPPIPQPFRTQVEQAPEDRFRAETQVSGELTIKKGEDEGRGQLRVMVHDSVTRSRINGAKVTVLQTGQRDETDGTGIVVFTVPAGSTYTAQVEHDDYRKNVKRSEYVNPETGVLVDVPMTRKANMGIISGIVIDSQNRQRLAGAEIKIEGPIPEKSRTYKTRADGRYNTESLDGNPEDTFIGRLPLPAGNYKMTASLKNYETQTEDNVDLSNDEKKTVNFRLKRVGGWVEKRRREAGEKGGLDWLNPDWLKENRMSLILRVVAAFLLTALVTLALYWPTLNALGQDNVTLRALVPFVFFLVMLSTIPSGGGKGNWMPFMIASGLAISTFAVLSVWAPPFARSSYILFGLPIVIYLISYHTAKQQGGTTKAFVSTMGVLLVLGGVALIWSLFSTGAAFNMETYLKTFDVLNLVGVPQTNIASMKQGVRNTLSFLQFKSAEPLKPEATKIGGFEAIEMKFGSRHNDFLLPTLFARMDYVLPVTVTNPNKFDTNLVVRDFRIDEIFMNNGSKTEKIICGGESNCPEGYDEVITQDNKPYCKNSNNDMSPATKYVNNLGSIRPEEERVVTVEFKGRKFAEGALAGEKVDCRLVIDRSNPLSTETISVNAPSTHEFCDGESRAFGAGTSSPEKYNACLKRECTTLCNSEIQTASAAYGVDNEQTPDSASFKRSDNACTCKINRYNNIMDDLCFVNNDKTRIDLQSTYTFNVEGKGELIVIKSEDARKLAPKPVITSSAGPLTVTTYFVSDVHVTDSNSKVTRMFVDIKNEGEGFATINKLDKTESLAGLEIKGCVPNPEKLIIGKDGISISCQIETEDDRINNAVTGSYLTVPVLVDIDYSYSEIHSTTVNVKKESIPSGITDPDKITDLERQFSGLPYYCETGLEIYARQPAQTTQQESTPTQEPTTP